MLIDGENGATDDEELPDLETGTDGAADTGTDDAAGETEGDKSGTGSDGKQLSLRDALIKATKEAEEKHSDTQQAIKTAKGKNDVVKDPATGKFKGKDPAAVAAAEAAAKAGAQGGQQQQAQQTQTGAVLPSKRFPAAIQAELSKLPAPVIAALNQREEQVERELTANTEERKMGAEFSKTVAPYIAQIRSEGATPISAVAELFNMAYFLRNPTITPAAKGKFLWDTARQFGADMRLGQQQAVQQPFNPQLNALHQQVNGLQQQLKQQEDGKKAAEQEAVNSQIAAFRADSAAHPHFEAVALDMAAMIGAGRAANLQEAYDKAVYANPEIRSIVMATEAQVAEQKRVADQKAKADAAKRAGGSVRGGPGKGATKDGKVVQKSLRDELIANLRSVSEG